MSDPIKNIREYLNRDSALNDEQTEAMRTLIDTYDECDAELALFNEEELRSEYEIIVSNLNSQGADLNENEIDYGCEVESKIRKFYELKETKQKTFYTLYAFEHFLKHDNRSQILNQLSSEPWQIKHEILTRWSWIATQHKKRQKGCSFNRLYLCEVGSKIHRKTLDREYHTLLRFLPHYCRALNVEYLLYDKQEPPAPDFLLVDSCDEYIYLEITEATLNNRFGFEEKQRELLYRRLYDDFSTKEVTLTVISRPNWSMLFKRYNEVKNWLESILENLTFPETEQFLDFSNKELSLSLRISKSNDFNVSDMSGDGNGLGYFGNSIENKVSRAILSTINKKTQKKYETKSPCILVIYDNAGLPVADFGLVREKVLSRVDSSWQSNFLDIWLADESTAFSIINQQLS